MIIDITIKINLITNAIRPPTIPKIAIINGAIMPNTNIEIIKHTIKNNTALPKLINTIPNVDATNIKQTIAKIIKINPITPPFFLEILHKN